MSRVPVPVPENFKLQPQLLVPEGKMLGCRLGNSPLNSYDINMQSIEAAVDKQEARETSC